MELSREKYCNEIRSALLRFADELKVRNRGNLTDWNVYAEDVICSVLDPLLGTTLRSANVFKSNAPAFDLIDEEKRVLVQVSVDHSRKKIQGTLNNEALETYEGYRLVFIFLVPEHTRYTKKEFANPHGVRFDRNEDIWDISGIMNAMVHLSIDSLEAAHGRVLQELHRINESQESGRLGSDIVRLTHERLKAERRNHQSFILINNSPIAELLPKGVDERLINNSGRRVVLEGREEPVSFRSFFKSSWKSNRQVHLFVTGKGGIGKTVAMLTFATEPGFLPKDVPVFYIPLYRLADHIGTTGNCAEDYISSCLGATACEELCEASRLPWDKGPNLILLLDGYNEIPFKSRGRVERDLRDWAVRPGTQLVIMSRTYGLTGVETLRLRLQPLSRDDIAAYLSGEGLGTPKDSDILWQVLSTPLMLKIYADVKRFMRVYAADWLSMRATNTGGNLIWDFLQIELYRCVKRANESATPGSAPMDYVDAILLVMSYVCWEMERRQLFDISPKAFDSYVRAGCQYWHEKGRVAPGYVSKIKSWFSNERESDADGAFAVQREILSKETALIHRAAGLDRYALLHQEFRDALAALHIHNASLSSLESKEHGNDKRSSKARPLPKEFRESISDEVVRFLAEFSTAKAVKQLWNANRAESPTSVAATHNLLRLAQRRGTSSISTLSFAGMDLRDVNLYRYREGLRSVLSHDPKAFKKTTIGASCFVQQGHFDGVLAICFSSNGRLIATSGNDGIVRLWDANTLMELDSARSGGRLRTIFFSEADSLLMGCHDNGNVWCRHLDATVTTVTDDSTIDDEDASAGGRTLAYGIVNGYVTLWDVSGGMQVATFGKRKNRISHFCISSDGGLVAYVLQNGTIRLWDTCDRRRRAVLKTGSEVSCLAISPDNSMLALCDRDGTIRIHDTQTRGLPQTHVRKDASARSMCFSPDSKRLAFSTDDRVCIWDFFDCDVLKASAGIPGKALAFSPRGNILACGYADGTIRLWNCHNGDAIGTLDDVSIGLEQHDQPQLVNSTGGSLLAYRCPDGVVRVWDLLAMKEIAVLEPGNGTVSSISFARKAQQLAVCYRNGAVRLWDLQRHTYNEIVEGGTGESTPTRVWITPDASVLVCSIDAGPSDKCTMIFRA